jgi:2-C-methyl-D-erythritol 4-phosphate cytidylyltransferase
MNTAIIVAAGSGTRFDPATPKQFLDLLGKPVILHTINRFQDCPAIGEIIVVVAELDVDRVRQLASFASKVREVVAGGRTRAESVRNGFEAVSHETAIVCVHDGVRPLVTSDEIARTITSAEQNGAACLVAPVTDTIKTVEYGKITGTVDRSTLRRALTPQAFRYSVFRDALDGAELNEDATDECYLVERSGVMITTVEGSARNIKITHREDLTLAEVYLKEEQR